MTKNEFLRSLVSAGRFPNRRAAATALEAILDGIGDALESGDDVNLTGFGRFHVAERAGRRGVNPRTGEPIAIPAGRSPRFTAGTALKARVGR